MANVGVGDIENFESKIRFALMVGPPEEIIFSAMENYERSITAVTLEAWRSGKNRPSKNKLKLVASILHIDTVDFYLDFEYPGYCITDSSPMI
jgi:transcriptional regulator with XRE-family HTH domain